MGMIKLLIADDEKMIREGLSKTIPWGEWGIELVGIAKNGLEALELCEKIHPNIVLTDVCMPKMDGLELMKEMRKTMPFIKVIILSGHDEFIYAKEAIKYGAVDYLIKPVIAEELKKVLSDVVEQLSDTIFQDNLVIEQYKKMDSALEQYYNALKVGTYEDSRTYLLRVVNEFVRKNIPIDHFQRLCTQIVTTVMTMMEEAGYIIEAEYFTPYHNVHKLMIDCTQPKELIDCLNNFNNDMIHWIVENKNNHYHGTIQLALEYIEAHFTEPINIECIAEVVQLNKDYFSHIFKKSMGEAFTDYLNRRRIKEAKNLLLLNKYKVYEIADLVGYHDYKYFSIVFKKIVGVPPMKFTKINV